MSCKHLHLHVIQSTQSDQTILLRRNGIEEVAQPTGTGVHFCGDHELSESNVAQTPRSCTCQSNDRHIVTSKIGTSSNSCCSFRDPLQESLHRLAVTLRVQRLLPLYRIRRRFPYCPSQQHLSSVVQELDTSLPLLGDDPRHLRSSNGRFGGPHRTPQILVSLHSYSRGTLLLGARHSLDQLVRGGLCRHKIYRRILQHDYKRRLHDSCSNRHPEFDKVRIRDAHLVDEYGLHARRHRKLVVPHDTQVRYVILKPHRFAESYH